MNHANNMKMPQQPSPNISERRFEIAVQAMQAIIISGSYHFQSFDEVADGAYKYADEMMKRL